eukprot:gene50262-61496_t
MQEDENVVVLGEDVGVNGGVFRATLGLREAFGFKRVIDTPLEKYLFCLGFLVVFALLAKNLVRSAIGREWMAIRDMGVAAA